MSDPQSPTSPTSHTPPAPPEPPVHPESPDNSASANRKKMPARRSYLGMVGLRLLGHTGAKIGIIWIAIVTFFAVFSPFIASSFPLLLKTPHGWSSPLLDHLDAVDVILLIVTFAGILLACLKSWPFGRRLAAFAWITAVAIAAASWPEYTRSWPDEAAKWGFSIALAFTAIICLILVATIIGIPIRSRAPLRYKLATALPMIAIAVVLCVFPILPPRLVVYDHYRKMLAAGQASYALYTLIPYSPTDRLRDSQIDTRLLPPGSSFSKKAIRKAVRQQAHDDVPSDQAHNKQLLSALVADAFKQAARVKAGKTTLDKLDAPFEPDIKHHRADRQMIRLAMVKPDQQFHLMGTTAFGEDLASRMIHACRIAMSIGFIATGIALAIGVSLGGLMGYFSGWVDLIGMRLVEIFNAIPTLFLLIAIVAFYGRNLYLIMVIIGLTGWVGYTLFVRAEFLRLRDQEFVQAARAQALPLRSILFKHLLPNGIAPVVVTASFGIASAILAEATLSFLGLGLVDQPSWGQMLNEARSEGTSFYWWMALYPGLAIFLTVFAYNLVGEALRDAIDPHVVKE